MNSSSRSNRQSQIAPSPTEMPAAAPLPNPAAPNNTLPPAQGAGQPAIQNQTQSSVTGGPPNSGTAVPPNAPPAKPPSHVTYQISHQTEYNYSEPVAVCQNQLRMQPVTGGNLECQDTKVTIDPDPNSWDEHRDYFGNLVTTFSIESIHTALRVVVKSRVTVAAPSISESDASTQWEEALDHGQGPLCPTVAEHRYHSPRILPSETFAAYARPSFTPGRRILEGALDLTRRIHQDFAYDVTATTVDTTTEEAFQLKAGVCQDFAHVEIACLRSIGLAARYVSGYLRTTPPPGKERLIGADESHAWVELYAGEKLGWLGLDPTNACMVSTDHIPICIGRDYGDVSPMRGVVLGGGTNTLKVSVDVEPQPIR